MIWTVDRVTETRRRGGRSRGTREFVACLVAAVTVTAGCIATSPDADRRPTSDPRSVSSPPAEEGEAPSTDGTPRASPSNVSTAPRSTESPWAFRTIPPEGVTVNWDGAGFTFAVIDVPAGTHGVVSLNVTSRERPGDRLGGNMSVISVMAFVDGQHRVSIQTFSSGDRIVWLAADVRGISIDRELDGPVLEGGSMVRVWVDLPEFLEPWGDSNASRRFSLLAITSDPIGTSVHRLDREDAANVTVRFVQGEGARALIARDFDPRGALLQVGVASLVETQAASDLVHEVQTPCGLTGIFVPPTNVEVHRTDIGYENELGESDNFRSVGVGPYHAQDRDPTRGLRLISFASPATSWTFYIHALITGGLFGGEGLIYAPVSQAALEATPERCGVRPAMI